MKRNLIFLDYLRFAKGTQLDNLLFNPCADVSGTSFGGKVSVSVSREEEKVPFMRAKLSSL